MHLPHTPPVKTLCFRRDVMAGLKRGGSSTLCNRECSVEARAGPDLAPRFAPPPPPAIPAPGQKSLEMSAATDPRVFRKVFGFSHQVLTLQPSLVSFDLSGTVLQVSQTSFKMQTTKLLLNFPRLLFSRRQSGPPGSRCLVLRVAKWVFESECEALFVGLPRGLHTRQACRVPTRLGGLKRWEVEDEFV